jgi:hypothetical protein
MKHGTKSSLVTMLMKRLIFLDTYLKISYSSFLQEKLKS